MKTFMFNILGWLFAPLAGILSADIEAIGEDEDEDDD